MRLDNAGWDEVFETLQVNIQITMQTLTHTTS
jgi:hypothetical protein